MQCHFFTIIWRYRWKRSRHNQDIRHLNVHSIKESSYINLTRGAKAWAQKGNQTKLSVVQCNLFTCNNFNRFLEIQKFRFRFQTKVDSHFTVTNRDVREGTIFCSLSRNLRIHIKNYNEPIIKVYETDLTFLKTNPFYRNKYLRKSSERRGRSADSISTRKQLLIR